MLQDGLALVSLAAITFAIAVMTYFFFNSFRQHRRVLEKRWFARGQVALANGHPDAAVESFRSALSLSASNKNYEMALAEALAAAGKTEEAYAYFSILHDAEPGDGYLNLQLARLEVRRKNAQAAISFYSSALNGAWGGQGAALRLRIRLELAKYLLSLGRTREAQGELLTAEGNSLDNPQALYQIAGLLRQADDPSDSRSAYQRVEHNRQTSPALAMQAMLQEAQTTMAIGQYKRAALALERYTAKERLHPHASPPQDERQAAQQLARLRGMLQLIPFYGLQPQQRAKRILLAAGIAHKRVADCMTRLQPQTQSQAQAPSQSAGQPGPAQMSPPDVTPQATAGLAQLTALGSQWQQMGPLTAKTIAADSAVEQNVMDWTSKAELLTAQLCGAPTGTDALLLRLAQVPDKTE